MSMSPRRPAYFEFRSYAPPWVFFGGDTPHDPRIEIYARHRLSKRICVRAWLDFNKIEVVA